MNVNLHVERLVLDGLDLRPAQRAQFQAAFTRELSRLISACGITSGPDAGGAGVQYAPLSPDLPPDRLGAQVAQAVYRGMGNAPCEGES